MNFIDYHNRDNALISERWSERAVVSIKLHES